ncbi:MAG: ribosome maturation factor RimP [Tissierellia bacterium]|nr:ribosome maturation factor RimP [Tissierellia bacterium]
MRKKDIELTVKKFTEEVLKDTNMELVDAEYVKEGPFKYLRVYIDKPGGVTVDDCADVSRVLNKKLDKVDIIKEQYFLEVSSPGIERPFKTEEDYRKNIGELVEAKFYKAIKGKKSVQGILEEKSQDNIVIKSGDEVLRIELKDLSKINRVVEDF